MRTTSDILTASEPYAGRLYLANGYMSTALGWAGGTLYESEANPCYIRGVYNDMGAGGVDRLALVPCWSQVRYGTPATMQRYRRELDPRRGVVRTEWTLEETRGELRIEQSIFASRADRHQAAVRTIIRPEFDGIIELITGLEAAHTEDIVTLGLGTEDHAIRLQARTRRYEIEIGTVLHFPEEGWQAEDSVGQNIVTRVWRRAVRRGEEVTLTQIARQVTSLEAERPIELAHCAPASYDQVLCDHVAAWARLWETDILVEGDEDVQRFARAALYYLWSSVREGDVWSVAPMGLSSNGYNGHIFWDAEIWMYPSLLVTQPDMAQACVAYRERTIGPARERAAENGAQGARFPWEGGFTGVEMTPIWAETRDFQLHITADVAIAHWWQYLNTGDPAWLQEHGWPVIKACAEYWQSRVEPSERGYQISDVVCADEYAAHVNNDAFTNAAVAETMRLAMRAAELVGEAAPPAWRKIAEGMYLAYDRERGIHLEYDGYDGEVTKQADVELLSYPLGYVTEPAQTARDLDYYATVIDPNGPAMSFSVYSVISAQLGRQADAYEYLKRSYLPNTRPPFLAFSETPTNNEFLFCTGVGGALQALLFGFTGLRLHEGYFTLSPLLPDRWKALRLRNLFVQGARMDIELEPGRLTLCRRVGDGALLATIERRDNELLLSAGWDAGGTLTVEVDGSRMPGAESVRLPANLSSGVRLTVEGSAAFVLGLILKQPACGGGIFSEDANLRSR